MAALATLIILGGSACAAAESAVRGGFEPYCIDLFADADTQSLGPTRRIERYPAEFLRALAEAPEAPWIYTGGLENYPRLVSRLSNLRPLLGNGAPTLSLVRDPNWLARVLQGNEILFPETHTNYDLVPREGRWLVKPVRSGGGMGIQVAEFAKIQSSSDSEFWRIQLQGRVYQRLIEGETLSASFLASGNNVQWIGAAGQWLGGRYGAPQPFQYAGSFAPAVVTSAERESLVRVAELLVRESGLQGLFGIDLVRGRDGLWLIEINPRYTASMELHEAIQGRLQEDCKVAEFARIPSRESPEFWRIQLQEKTLQSSWGRSLVAEHCAAFDCDLSKSALRPYSKQLSTRDSPSTGSVISASELRLPLSKGLSPHSPIVTVDATIGKIIVYADADGVAGDSFSRFLTVIREERGVIVADIPPAMSVISQESPVCTLITSGRSVNEVERVLLAAALQVKESLARPNESS